MAGNFGVRFSLNFLRIIFLCISEAPFGWSLWSGHHWKDLFFLQFLQKLSTDDDNFGQGWWRQKWKKGQGSSRPVTGGTGVNSLLGSFSKPRRRRRRERHQTKGFMNKTMAVHLHFESRYISLPSSAKQQREMTNFRVFWRTRTAKAKFLYLLLELNAIGACSAWASF